MSDDTSVLRFTRPALTPEPPDPTVTIGLADFLGILDAFRATAEEARSLTATMLEASQAPDTKRGVRSTDGQRMVKRYMQQLDDTDRVLTELRAMRAETVEAYGGGKPWPPMVPEPEGDV